MKKRITLGFLSIILLLVSLTACGSASTGQYYGDQPTKTSLRICIDSYYVGHNDPYEVGLELDELIQDIKTTCGIEQITIVAIPAEGAERATALQRMRTEIMAGSGPDLFLLRTQSDPFNSVDNDLALFNYPEKGMEAGLFLPLDDYMENNTRFTDWDKQTQAVLNAGRNADGQQIIPLTYTFPVVVYPEKEVKIPYTKELTMQDILANPETAELGAILYSDMRKTDEPNYPYGFHFDGPIYALGKFADFEKEELLFTEEELYEMMTTMTGLHDTVEENPYQYFRHNASYYPLIYEVFNGYFDTEMALVPTYTIDGGVAVTVNAFAAVNRNTTMPEEAFTVIDYLMQEKVQRESIVYSLCFTQGLPLQNDLGSEEKTLEATGVQRYLDTPYFEDLLAIKEQITAVNFENNLDSELQNGMYKFHRNEEDKHEIVSGIYERMERMMGE